MFGQLLFLLILQDDPPFDYLLVFTILGVVASALGFMFMISLFLSHIGPWHKLAKVYKNECYFEGPYIFPKIWIEKIPYSGYLKMRFTQHGLCLSMFPWIRRVSSPVLIPWLDITLVEIKRYKFYSGYHEWSIGNPKKTSFFFRSESLYRIALLIPKPLLEFQDDN